MEIIGALRDKLNITGSIEESEDAIEKMASVKTLNGLIAWMEELANGSKDDNISVNANVSDEVVEIQDNTEEENLLRLKFNLEEKFLDSSEPLQIDGKRFALTDDGGSYAQNIKKLLEGKGALVDLITGDEELTVYDGLIVLNASRSPKKYNISKVFSMIKRTDLAKIKWIYTFSDLLGNLETVKGITELREIQGFPGLIKSLSQEFPNINFRAVVFHSIFNNKTLPQIVMDELLTRETIHIEIVYKDTERYFYNLKPDTLSMNGTTNLVLDKNSTIVVFGGAQGITPELISQLAKEYPCRYILVGRSEQPTVADDKYIGLESKDMIRKYLIQEEKMRQPAEIEKRVQKIYKMNQIRANIQKIENAGAEVIYKSLDIKNDKALRSFLQETYDTYGKIDGIIHAAGLLDDKLFIHKTVDSFEQIYSTKVAPFRVLLEELRPDLKLFVMFSSVASTYGNRGQTDYASANSVFDLVASLLSKKTDTRILTINWGPWKGAGMVSSTLEDEFKKRGVALIPMKAGAECFVNELKYGKETNILVMGGSEVVNKLF
jgi:NAD(P)-dependent dehydrogenase (short-subunit alcohol dehydrogenase family)